MCHVGGCQLCKENVLTALDQVSIYHHGTAHCRLPEWHVKYMMQTKRNERTLNDAENQGSEISGSSNQSAQRKDAVLDSRPDKIHQNANCNISNRGNDRHKAGSAKKR